MRGFTLFEILASFAIIALISAMVVPNVVETRRTMLKRNAKDFIETVFQRARSETLAAATRGVLTTAESGAAVSFGLDYIPYTSPPAAESVLFYEKMPRTITVVLSASATFDSDGYLIDSGGSITTLTVTLKQLGTTFCTGTAYAIGQVVFSC